MNEPFDPYYTWLGISPKEQPVDLYRLLGVQRFESDTVVIESAADQRMAHLRTFQTGPRGELAARILNELAAARVTLHVPQKKAAYDDGLRSIQPSADPSQSSPFGPATPAEILPPPTVREPLTVPAARWRSPLVAMIGGSLAATVIFAAAIVYTLSDKQTGGETDKSVQTETIAAKPAEEKGKPTPAATVAAKPAEERVKPAPAATVVASASPPSDPKAVPVAAPAESAKPGAVIKIERARWGGGDNWADVTQRVQEAVDHHDWVWASVDFLNKDPTPGWRKHLAIIYKQEGSKSRTITVDEGGAWRKEQYEAEDTPAKVVSGSPQPAPPTSVATNKSPAIPAKPAAESADQFPKTIVELGEAAAQIRTGGGGRFLIFHLKNTGSLAIVDVTKSAVVKTIGVPDDVRYAASVDKLLVVLPAQKLIQRYSLTDFQREKTAPLPDDAPMFVAVMGCNSGGPLVLRGEQGRRDYHSGGLLFWDIEKMAVAALPRDLIGGGPIRISADGKTLIGWTSGITGQTFQLARFTPSGIQELRSPDGHDYNGWWATPTADGSYVVRYNAGIYSHALKLLPSDALSGSVLMPCEDPRLMLAARLADRRRGRASSELSIVTLNDQQILYTLATPELESKAIISTEQGYFYGEPRAHFLPDLKAVVTFPDSNDKVVIRKFDLAQALNERKTDYLFVVSKPPGEVIAGETFTYRPEVLTNAKSVKYKLESGPEGMRLADDGQITWPVKKGAIENGAKVIISASADNGKTAFHSFGVSVGRSGAVPKTGDQPNQVAGHPTRSSATRRHSSPTNSTSDVQPGDLQQDVVQLGESATQMSIGGKGRYMIFHLKTAGKLAIVDVTKSAVVNSIDVPDDVRYAASLDKLLVVLPAQKLIQRYSLKTLEREKTASLPDDAPTSVVVMGCNSDGPLVLRGSQGQLYSAGKLLFWDIDKMAVSGLPRNIIGGDAIRISADGKTLTGWTTGISGQRFELVRMTARRIEKLMSPDTQDYNGWWATPTADGSYVLRFSSGIYSRNLKPLSSNAFKDDVLMPCEDPRFMLALRLADAPQSSQVKIVTLADQKILYTLETPEFHPDQIGSAQRGYFNNEPRAHYLPELKAFVTVPDSNDKVIIRDFNLVKELQRKHGYLLVVSKPPAQATVGEMFTYQPHVLTDAKSTKYRLEVAPPGAHIAADGVITWRVTAQPVGGTAKFAVSISGDNGKDTFHAFELTVTRDGPEVAAHRTPGDKTPAALDGVPTESPENQELVSAGKFRLAGSKGSLAVIPGRDAKSLLVLQEDRLAILGPDGITIQKQVKLPKKYTFLGEREKYYIAIAAEPQSIDLIDKTSLTVLKSLKLPGMGVTDLALHPTEALAYVAYKAGVEIPRFRFLLFDEKSGEAHELDHCIGKWLQVSPDGSFLIAGYSDIYERGQQLVVNPDNIFFVPEYGSIDWLIRYDLKDPEAPVGIEKQDKAGGNGGGLRMSADGKRVTYLSHVGFPMYSNNLGGWDPADLHKLPASYGTKDVGTPLEFAYHPVLPLAASFGKSTAVVFDRETGDLQPDRVKLLDDEQLEGNIQRIYFTPDGRHLLFDAVVNQFHYLVQADLKLTPDEIKQLASPPPAPPKPEKKATTT